MRESTHRGVLKSTGKTPAGAKWVDTNKGDKESPEYRCRSVDKEIRKGERVDLLAAAPPLEAKKKLFSFCVSEHTRDALGFWRCDSHLLSRQGKAESSRGVAQKGLEESKHGLLKKATYGARNAAQNWEMEYTEMMVQAGFKQEFHSACVFYRSKKNFRISVHRDAFTELGPRSLYCLRGFAQE